MNTEAAQQARSVLGGILRLMEVEHSIAIDEDDNLLTVQVESPDAARLIGRNAQMLLSMQYLLNRILRRMMSDAPFCQLDIDHYRQRRCEKLVQQAHDVAAEVERSGRTYRFAPMNAIDRRIVHQALAANKAVYTESSAENREGMKTLAVHPSRPEKEPPPGETSSTES